MFSCMLLNNGIIVSLNQNMSNREYGNKQPFIYLEIIKIMGKTIIIQIRIVGIEKPYWIGIKTILAREISKIHFLHKGNSRKFN